MAALQGYLLRHKEQPQEAIGDVDTLVRDLENRQKDQKKDHSNQHHHVKRPKEVKPRPVRPLTVEQVDKMFFNPQEGWDKDL